MRWREAGVGEVKSAVSILLLLLIILLTDDNQFDGEKKLFTGEKILAAVADQESVAGSLELNF
jgi:hypothetical protein